MPLNDIKFEKTTGGMGRPASNDDVISGLIMSLNGKIAAIPAGMELIANAGLGVAKIKYFEQLAGLGIVETEAGEDDIDRRSIFSQCYCVSCESVF